MSIPEEIDFEVDADDLSPLAADARPLGAPSLVVDDLYITYRVFGGKRVGAGVGAPPSLLKRLLGRGRTHVGGVTSVEAVKGISFVARHGESIGIVGINGSGKSTLMRAIAGLIPPTQGAVYVSGDPSLLGVNAVLMGSLTGERNVMIGGLALGLSPEEVREKFDDIVEFSGIGDAVYLPMSAYSSGMGARLRFAISAAAVPDVLMIDEALATGDAAFRKKSKDRIDAIRDQAATVFLVSHSLATIESICSRTLWIHQGKLVMDGPAAEVCAAYKAFVKAQDGASR
ncbi:ABC transporter ATP-binding protein [Cellulomonas sp. JH27-2]|uniref:ABC transporter ATP-binding protein n=1 Tax=Cellulomonas sp. JH27-2 TaxID=2774139 RepID=UPI00177DA81A|nr:ABC transporter ATP-binding protein [Cellulomonas sp. JH27-2]MBD8060448.1 ABC transporter ATP-binding protein [Cellulomonas sp. JH27-2]